MSKLPKKLGAFLLAAMMCGSFAACSQNETGKNSSGTDNSGTESSEKPELRFTSWANTGEVAVIQRAIDAYNEKQDNVTVVFEPTASDTYEQKLLTSLAGGTACDVFYMNDNTTSKLIENGSVVSLDEFMETDESYCKQDEFDDGIWGTARTAEGKIYGIPPDANPAVLYYQPSMLKEIGAESPQDLYDAGNWTWEKFSEINQKLADSGKAGYIFDGEPYVMYSWISANQGTIWQGDTYQYDDKALEAIHYCADELEAGRWTWSGLLPQGQGDDAQFLSGLCGFIRAGRWNTPTFASAELEHDYIPFPTKDGSKNPSVIITVVFVGVNANSKYLDEAMKFVTYYCSKEGQKIRLEEKDGQPGNAINSIRGIDDQIIDSENPIPEHANYLYEMRTNGWVFGGDFAKDSLYPGLIGDLISIYQKAWVGEASIDDVIAEAEQRANEMVAENS